MNENVFELRETFRNEQKILKRELKETIKNVADAIVEVTKNFPPDIICKVWEENREFDSFECKKESEGILAVFWGNIEVGKFQYDDTAEKDLERILKENFSRFFKGIACYHIDFNRTDNISIYIDWKREGKENLLDRYVAFEGMIESCGFTVNPKIKFPGFFSCIHNNYLERLRKPQAIIKVTYEKLDNRKELSYEKPDA